MEGGGVRADKVLEIKYANIYPYWKETLIFLYMRNFDKIKYIKKKRIRFTRLETG